MKQFSRWYRNARLSLTTEFPNAVCLSTVSASGFPEGRMVLLKGFDEAGFVFYTNLESAKGQSLLQNSRAALTFYWGPAQRQVRIRGYVELVDDQTADRYFKSRPRRSQIGAWASEQSRVLASRAVLEKRVEEFRERFHGQIIPRPPQWSGFRLKPFEYEFWQLRLNRLHDRFLFSREDGGNWKCQRLYP